jgi:hypothetical protein
VQEAIAREDVLPLAVVGKGLIPLARHVLSFDERFSRPQRHETANWMQEQ